MRISILLALSALLSPLLAEDRPPRVDAAVGFGGSKIYVFTGKRYSRFDLAAAATDAGYPMAIDQRSWPGLPWTDAIDAAVPFGDGKVCIFKGAAYVRFDVKTDRVDPGYPKPIDQATWPGLPWSEGIDAAVNGGNGKLYLFKGSEYVRFDIQSDRVDAGYPKPIDQVTWPGLPWTSGIDAAVEGGAGKIYLFKGRQYARFDLAADRMEAGYPKPIDQATWPGLDISR